MKVIEDLLSIGAPEITPERLDRIVRMIPHLRAKFASREGRRPDLNTSIDFLSQLIEDFAVGLCTDLPYHTAADIAFTLQYLDQDLDVIPDSLPDIGFVDDAALSNRVLEKHQHILKEHARQRGFQWDELVNR